MECQIPFNKPFIVGRELEYIAEAVAAGDLSGGGRFTRDCAEVLQNRFGIHKVLLTPSCTAALEMAAMLCGLQPGDEVIMPSYTFVSTANAVVRLGARPVFVDVRPDTLNLDERLIEAAITTHTKAIVPVHYAGVACEMDTIVKIAERHGLMVVEDAAQAVGSSYRGRALGSVGQMAAFSFHETKNVICGQGGALCLNDPTLVERAEILRDRGTNRQKFLRGQADKYTWVDVGSAYAPSEICSAFLYAQLEMMDMIAERRRSRYVRYQTALAPLEASGVVQLPAAPPGCQGNAHIFWIVLRDQPTRDALIDSLRGDGILAVFHYVPLHSSPMGKSFGYQPDDLPVTENLSGRLLRLPLYHELKDDQQQRVIDHVVRFLTSPGTVGR
jgi:dTDP-4-amino-4,6-dideoxygalactose transaminase